MDAAWPLQLKRRLRTAQPADRQPRGPQAALNFPRFGHRAGTPSPQATPERRRRHRVPDQRDRRPAHPTCSAPPLKPCRVTDRALPGGDNPAVTTLVAMQPGVHMDSFRIQPSRPLQRRSGLVRSRRHSRWCRPRSERGQLLNTIPTRLIQNLEIYTGGFRWNTATRSWSSSTSEPGGRPTSRPAKFS